MTIKKIPMPASESTVQNVSIPNIDILIITALLEERKQIQIFLSELVKKASSYDIEDASITIIEQKQVDKRNNIKRFFITYKSGQSLTIGITHLPIMGNAASALSAYHLIRTYLPKSIIFRAYFMDHGRKERFAPVLFLRF